MIQNINWNSDFIGILATEDDLNEYQSRHKPIFVNNQNYLQFYIKNIAEPPENFPNRILFTCYSSEIQKYGFEENFAKHEFDREKELKDFLSESLIIFRPFRKVHQIHGEIFLAKEIRLIAKSESYKEKSIFKAIPVFSEEVHKINFDEFKSKLEEGKYVGKLDNISTDIDDTPTIILWRHNLLNYEMFGLFKAHEYAYGGFRFIVENGLRRRKVDEDWILQSYREGEESDTLLFVDTNAYTELEKELEDTPPLEEYGLYSNILYDDNKEKVEQEKEFVEVILEDDNKVDLGVDPNLAEEEKFMELFILVTREMDLSYNERDLYNFHTAMKSNSLTILAGMSGTGKSRLVQAYGRALGLDPNQLIFIPVRPSWTDDSDVIGYVDTINMVYRPGDSGLIDTLIQAQTEEKRNKLFVICFDEMNLARVEHYFSQFLSVLEMDTNRRTLRLYSDRISSQIYNSINYPSEIQIGQNVIFVGTVNLDESTYHFSDKVLDRANVITLDIQPYEKLKGVLFNEQKEKEKEKENLRSKKLYSFEQYDRFRKQEKLDKTVLTDTEIAFLWKMHEKMQLENRNLGIGPRVIKQIYQYIKNLPINEYLTRKEAFDLQIVQRVLTKLRGSEGLLKELVGKVDQNGIKTNGSLFELIEEFPSISNFEHSKKVLIQKAKELKVNGFTI